MENLVTIEKFNTLSTDERGVTADFTIPRKQDNFIFLTRKDGSISGNTYHKGCSDFTNPKIFLLINGSVKLSYRHIESKQRNVKEITQPSKIIIQPNVTHSIEALSDIILLECNSIKDIQDDREHEKV